MFLAIMTFQQIMYPCYDGAPAPVHAARPKDQRQLPQELFWIYFWNFLLVVLRKSYSLTSAVVGFTNGQAAAAQNYKSCKFNSTLKMAEMLFTLYSLSRRVLIYVDNILNSTLKSLFFSENVYVISRWQLPAKPRFPFHVVSFISFLI